MGQTKFLPPVTSERLSPGKPVAFGIFAIFYSKSDTEKYRFITSDWLYPNVRKR
jgi:hypothetical protein